jgi:hypothetical protein
MTRRSGYGLPRVDTSMDDFPATSDMHFRNGAVAFVYIGTLLMPVCGVPCTRTTPF